VTGTVDDSDLANERWTADVVLADGESVMIRAMVPGEAEALRAFHRRQSPDSIYRRFFSPKPEMTPEMAEYFTAVDPDHRTALAVWRGDDLIGWASYERWASRDDAEVAFMVDDDHRGKGIATLLLEHLAAIARGHGITRFTAETLADNRAMLTVFAKAGWPVHQKFDSGVIDVDFDLTDDAAFVGSVERREQRADSKAMARLLLPRTVAVVGASDTPRTVGDALWRHLRGSFSGPLYAVNPNHDTVGGVHAYRSVIDIPDDVSLAVIAVPIVDVVATVRQCVTKHVRGAVIVTDLEESDVDVASLVAEARHSGMRVIGPASMGIASPNIGFQAALVDVHLPPGNVAVSMQSGTLGGSLLRQAADLSLGLSWFVSLGDKCDVSGNDLLQFWSDDEATSVIALYTETFGNPRKFARIARRVARTRPIVAVRTGAAAITDSTGAIYQQAGVIEVPTVTALLDTARVLASQPIPAGPRVAVLTNSRSPGTLAEAALTAAGLVTAPQRLRVNHRAPAGEYAAAITATLADDDIDAVMVIYAPAVEATVSNVAPEIDRAAGGATKPVLAVMLGSRDGPVLSGSQVPSFSFPETAAAVLGRMWAYGQWRALEAEGASDDPADVLFDDAQTIIDAALAAGTDELSFAETCRVLESYGIPVATAGDADSAESAVVEARRIGYPVGMKARRRRIGRSVHAGVALDLTDDDDVVIAFGTMRESLGDDAASVTVQRMVPPGVDVRVRARAGERIGPVVDVGLGGVQADVIDSGVHRLAPLSPSGARQLLETSRVAMALHEAGLPADRLVDVIVRVSRLAFEHAELTEIELNPVIVSEGGIWATDVRGRVTSAPAPGPLRLLG